MDGVPVIMWKNIFIESCILSAIIFGGFYMNTAMIKKEISVANDSAKTRTSEHISGATAAKGTKARLCGSETPMEHISGGETDPSSTAPVKK